MKVLIFFIAFAYAYNTTTDCITCLNTPQYKYCQSNTYYPTGYCCNSTDTKDFCSNSGYLCSDKAQTTSMKYAFCPKSYTKCIGGTPNFQLTSTISRVGATTLDFGKDDICHWEIFTESEYYFNKKIKVTVENIYSASLFINTGSSLVQAQNE